jgi:lysophospholipase L1-like esterase
MGRTTTLRSLIALAAVLALASVPAAASAVTIPPSPGGPAYSYVALGDSYASGEGLSPFASGSDTSADKCHRSLRSYPFLIHAELALGRFHDYACSGATTDRISTSTQYGPEGLPQAYHRPVEHAQLVTVTVGGDDVGFSHDLTYCAEHKYCQRNASFVNAVNQEFAALPAKLDAAYDAIRRNKRKRATIIVLGYPRLFPMIKSHQQCQIIHGHFGFGFEDSEQDYFNAKAAQLDQLVSAAATRAGFFFISPLDAFVGHAQCDPDPWLNGLSIHIGDHPTFKASFHPNTEGQREYANLLEGGIANYRGPVNPDGLPTDPKPTRHLPKPPTPCVTGHPC